MKKYLFLIPTLFVMLLTLVPSFSVMALGTIYDSETIETYTDYWDFDIVEPLINEAAVARKESIKADYEIKADYYFYCVGSSSVTLTSDIVSDGSLRDYLFYFDSTDIVYEDSEYITFKIQSYYMCDFSITDYTASWDSISNRGVNWYVENVRDYFTYSKKYGVFYVSSSFTSSSKCLQCDFIFYQDSNIPAFPFADGISNNSKGLNVNVIFLPALSGEVDRNISREDGISSLVSNMKMTVINNSSFPVQYKMYIMKKNQITHRHEVNIGSPGKYINSNPFSGTSFDDDPVFVYYSNEWVYSSSLDSSATWLNQVPEKQNKATEWHYLSAKDSVDVTFNFSQINLIEKEEYIVYVDAVRCDYGCSSLIFQSAVEDIYPELKQLSQGDVVTVHQSTFSMVHYSDVKYDPADSSNGVLPYSSYDDGYTYSFSYNAREKDDGTVDYTKKDVSSSASKGSTWGNVSSGSIPSGSSSNSSSASFLSLSNSFSNFFRFVNQVFNYFPLSITSVYAVGVTSIVVLGIVKAVFK